MSPQPDVVLDVQKYIGTCLISQKPRGRKSGRTKGHPRKAYPPPPVHGYSRCECCGQFRYGHGPAQPPASLQWTGYPLYNLAGYKKKAHVSKCIKIPGPDCFQSEGELSPDNLSPPVRLSKLAIHAHGAPLILACGPARNRPLNRSFIREFQEGLALSEHQDPDRDGPKGTGEPVAPDGHCLRVLKPRKRRKRDRRLSHAEDGSGPKTLLTLEPYRPLCYRFDAREETDYGKGSQLEKADGAGQGSPKCPYAASNLCCCNACRVVPSLPSPPLSPRSSTSSLSPCSSCSSTDSCSSLPSESVSPFPTPPPSPLSLLSSKEQEAETVDSVSPPALSGMVAGNHWEVQCLTSGYRERDWPSFARKVPTLTSNWLSQWDLKRSFATFRPVAPLTSTQPPARPWVSMHNPTRNQPACTFTVMCYNVLCDKYATRQMYGYCPNWALNWEYRRKGIMDEIRHYSADVISLQEVETEQFYNMFLPELRKDGYEGIFSPKSRAKTMNENDRKYVDGCAIFFRAHKFRLIKDHLVEFTQLAMANAEGSDDMLNRVMTKDNIALAALLETREGAWENSQVPVDPSHIHQPLLVCTAHIHWDPEYCDVKLIQTMMLMHELRGIVEESSRSFRPRSHKPNCNAIPLLLCGDFNSLPDSGVIEYLTSGRISTSHPDLKQLGYKTCLQKLNTSEKPNEYTHSFKMARAYSDENMPFTNFTFDFKGIIDYILHSETLKPIGLLGPLDLDWLRIHKVVGYPHPHVPSDHLPLLVEYEMPAQQPPLTNGLVVQR